MPVEVSQYIYGNSLVNFAGGSAQSNVPYWMNQFAESADNTYIANGGYGFLRQFSDRETPSDEWGFDGVAPLWNSESSAFDSVSFDTVMITPGNFLQGNEPDANYAGDDRSPLDATIDIVRDTIEAQPNAQIYLYEGWADLGSAFGYPVSDSQLNEYHDYNAGAYHDWYVDLTDSVNQAVPGADVQLIPVASVMAELFTDGPLEGLTLDDLYVDSAPHGTETVYFLASMITYPATFGEAVPADFEVPDTVHPFVADNFELLNAQITNLMDVELAEVVVEDVNADPTVTDDVAELSQDEVMVIDLLANDSDADGDPLSIVRLGAAEFGSVALVDGQAVYTTAAGFAGSDSFTYSVSDGAGGIVDGRVDVLVSADETEDTPEPDPEPTPQPEPVPEPELPVGAGNDGFSAAYFELSTEITSIYDVDFSAPPSASGSVETLQYLEMFGSFAPESGVDNYASQYETVLNVTEKGAHEIFIVADDQALVSIDGQVVLDSSVAEAGDRVSVWLDLAEGEHDVQVHYLEVEGEQSLKLDWAGPSTGDEMVPLVGTVPGDFESEEALDEEQPDIEEADLDVSEVAEENPSEKELVTAHTDFGAKAHETGATSLKDVGFDCEGDEDLTIKGVTLACENGALLEGGPEDGAVQFCSQLHVENAGLYEIEVASDVDALVSISGLPVVGTETADAGEAKSHSIFLIAGEHNVDVRYLDTGSAQSLTVTWTGPDTDGAPLPLGDTAEQSAIAALFSDDVAARSDEEAFAIANLEEDQQEQEIWIAF